MVRCPSLPRDATAPAGDAKRRAERATQHRGARVVKLHRYARCVPIHDVQRSAVGAHIDHRGAVDRGCRGDARSQRRHPSRGVQVCRGGRIDVCVPRARRREEPIARHGGRSGRRRRLRGHWCRRWRRRRMLRGAATVACRVASVPPLVVTRQWRAARGARAVRRSSLSRARRAAPVRTGWDATALVVLVTRRGPAVLPRARIGDDAADDRGAGDDDRDRSSDPAAGTTVRHP